MSTGIGRSSNVFRYIDGAVEYEVAALQRRVSLVAGDELARMGEAAFDIEDTQDVFDSEIERATALHDATPEQTRVLGEQISPSDTRELDDLLGAETAAEVRSYIAERTKFAFAHDKKATERSGFLHPGSRPKHAPSVYMGTWKPDAKYDRGHTVTRSGLLWHSNIDDNAAQPGSDKSWTMMHKHEGGSNRKWDHHGPGATT
ncbi:MAG: hypothetical protein ABIU86_12780 [Gemmatimonadaceae bacterium]